MLLCLDDMHMTMADKYGSFPCMELLRQLLQEQGWYERKSLNWKVRICTKALLLVEDIYWELIKWNY